MAHQPIAIAPIDHIALLTTAPDRGEQFYCNVLGFRVVARPSFSFDGRWLEHDALDVMIHLIHRADHQPKQEGLNTLNPHFAMRCTAIDQAISTLEAHGVQYVERRLPDHGYRQIFFHDPDGNLLEIGEWPDRK